MQIACPLPSLNTRLIRSLSLPISNPQDELVFTGFIININRNYEEQALLFNWQHRTEQHILVQFFYRRRCLAAYLSHFVHDHRGNPYKKHNLDGSYRFVVIPQQHVAVRDQEQEIHHLEINSAE